VTLKACPDCAAGKRLNRILHIWSDIGMFGNFPTQTHFERQAARGLEKAIVAAVRKG
jgi:hypothetical protein